MIIGDGLREQFIAVAPYLKDVYGKDIIVWVSDNGDFLRYYPGDKIDIGSDGILGDDDPMREAMKTRSVIRVEENVGTLGMVIKSTSTPIFDSKNNVTGCICIGESLDFEKKVAAVAQQINEAVDNIDKSVKEFSSSAVNISNCEKELRDNINGVNELTQQISKVLSYTKKIALQTNLLGINAEIEASRAGEFGLGFGVVAEEIRNLSIESMNVAKNIDALLAQINTANLKTLESSDAAYAATVEQVAEAEKTTSRIVELKDISDDLKEIAKKL
ncbi:hypothetical protein MASR2M70_02910 [Bacillota bacterium]